MSKEIIIQAMLAGDPGTGKDKTAAGVVNKLKSKGVNIELFAMGDTIFRPMATLHGIPIEQLHERLLVDPSLEAEADKRLLALFEQPTNLITTSRMGPALLRQGKIHQIKNPEKIITICFDCEETERMKRIVRREFCKPGDKRLSDEDVMGILPYVKKKTLRREHNDETRFYELYGIKNIFEKAFFHEVIDTTKMTLDEQIEATFDCLMSYTKN